MITCGDYPFPPLVAGGAAPRWDGSQFILPGSASTSILAYHDHRGNWSDGLIRLHEAAGGAGDHPMDRASRELVFDTVDRESLPPGATCLDIGCSSGFLLRDFRRRLPQARVIGADFLRPPLERLAASLPGVPLLQFDLCDCPLPEASVDLVTALNVLEHVDDDARAVANIARILRPGGVAHIEVPACPACFDLYDEVLLHRRRYRMGALRALIRGAGLRPVRCTHLGVFVFPAFYLVKRRNRRLRRLTFEEKAAIVAEQLRRTHGSLVLASLLGLERRLGRFCRFPAGIRCVVAARRD